MKYMRIIISLLILTVFTCNASANTKFDKIKAYHSAIGNTFYFKLNYQTPNGITPEEFETYVKESTSKWQLVVNNNNAFTQIYEIKIKPEDEIIYLYPKLSFSLNKNDKVIIKLPMPKRDPNNKLISDDSNNFEGDLTIDKDVPKNYIFTFDPTFVPNQELLTGEKKDVYHFGVDLKYQRTLGTTNIYNVSVETNNIFSTESKDKATKIDAKIGLQTYLLSGYFDPYFEAKWNANQAVTNSSFVSSLGFQAILNVQPLRGLFWNELIKAPLSPFFTAALQYENRINKDDNTTVNHDKDNLLRIHGKVEFDPIHLLSGEKYSPNDITLKLLAEGWVFPDEKATAGQTKRTVEGHAVVALYIPVGFASAVLNQAAEGDKKPEAQKKLKLEYDVGANEANGFAKSNSVNLGFEIHY